MAQNFHLSKPRIAFFWAPSDQTMFIDKHIGACSHIESKKSSNT